MPISKVAYGFKKAGITAKYFLILDPSFPRFIAISMYVRLRPSDRLRVEKRLRNNGRTYRIANKCTSACTDNDFSHDLGSAHRHPFYGMTVNEILEI